MIYLRSRLYWMLPCFVFFGLNIFTYFWSITDGIGFPFSFLQFGNHHGVKGRSLYIEFILENILIDLLILVFTIILFYFCQKISSIKTHL